MEIYFITTSYCSQIYFIITSYMKYGWLWCRILDTGIGKQKLHCFHVDGAMMPLVERMVFLHISIHLECWERAHRCGSSPPGPQHTGWAARAGGTGASGYRMERVIHPMNYVLCIMLCYCIHQLQPHGHPGEPLGDGRDVAAVELVRGVDAVAVPLGPVHQVLNSRNVSTKFCTKNS